ncbi:hypothetical protein R6Q59_004159 [Mikania micrantha]
MVNYSFKFVFLVTMVLSIYGFSFVNAIRDANAKKSAPTVVNAVESSIEDNLDISNFVERKCRNKDDCKGFCPPGSIPICLKYCFRPGPCFNYVCRCTRL